MKQLVLSLVLLVMPLAVAAQSPLKYGYFSYREAFQSMPAYAVDGQKDFAPSILKKRQAELQELMEKNLAFKEEAKRLLKQAEEETYAPLRQRLSEVIRGIGDAKGYAFILNTDNDAVPYVNSIVGEDISSLIKDTLR